MGIFLSFKFRGRAIWPSPGSFRVKTLYKFCTSKNFLSWWKVSIPNCFLTQRGAWRKELTKYTTGMYQFHTWPESRRQPVDTAPVYFTYLTKITCTRRSSQRTDMGEYFSLPRVQVSTVAEQSLWQQQYIQGARREYSVLYAREAFSGKILYKTQDCAFPLSVCERSG